MTDVRLTIVAEDGQVYPVLGNTKGELKLEEPTVNSDDYVAKSGDNMTGNLTLGTDKITLDATNGGATFAGTIQTGEITCGSASAAKIYLKEDGSASFSGGHFSMQDLQTGGTANNVFKIQGTDETGFSYLGSYLDRGILKLVRSDTAPSTGNYALHIGSTNNDSDAVNINFDGSATFTGDVVIGSRNKKWMIVESNGLAHLVEQTRVSVSDDVPEDEAAAKYPDLRNIPHELDLIEKALSDVMEKLRMNPPAGWPVWDGSDEI